jgi:hypothetical protein
MPNLECLGTTPFVRPDPFLCDRITPMRLITFFLIPCTLVCTNAIAADLRSIILNPEPYFGKRVVVTGIARVPGEFYLFDSIAAAAKRDSSKAALVIEKWTTKTFGLDRKWVRVTGVVRPGGGFGEARCTIFEDELRVISDKPEPGIKDPVIYGVFENTLSTQILIQLDSRTYNVRTEFSVDPHGSDKSAIAEGDEFKVFEINTHGKMLSATTKKGRLIASGRLEIPKLPKAYVYSAADSEQRTVHYRVTEGKIELVRR